MDPVDSLIQIFEKIILLLGIFFYFFMGILVLFKTEYFFKEPMKWWNKRSNGFFGFKRVAKSNKEAVKLIRILDIILLICGIIFTYIALNNIFL